jgi:hypothetical protein
MDKRCHYLLRKNHMLLIFPRNVPKMKVKGRAIKTWRDVYDKEIVWHTIVWLNRLCDGKIKGWSFFPIFWEITMKRTVVAARMIVLVQSVSWDLHWMRKVKEVSATDDRLWPVEDKANTCRFDNDSVRANATPGFSNTSIRNQKTVAIDTGTQWGYISVSFSEQVHTSTLRTVSWSPRGKAEGHWLRAHLG